MTVAIGWSFGIPGTRRETCLGRGVVFEANAGSQLFPVDACEVSVPVSVVYRRKEDLSRVWKMFYGESVVLNCQSVTVRTVYGSFCLLEMHTLCTHPCR